MKTCERHSCAVDRCDSAAQSHSAFCRRHGCEADNCTQYKEAQNWFCNQHECRRVRCHNKSVSGAGHCLRHLEEDEDEDERRHERRSHKVGRHGLRGSHYSMEPPLVIFNESNEIPSSYIRREPSPTCRTPRRGSWDHFPDCIDDAKAGRERRGYYDRAGLSGNHGRSAHCNF